MNKNDSIIPKAHVPYPSNPIIFAKKVIGNNRNRYVCEMSLLAFMCEASRDKCSDEKELLDHIYYLLSEISVHDIIDMIMKYRKKGQYKTANAFLVSPMYVKQEASSNVCNYIAAIRNKDLA